MTKLILTGFKAKFKIYDKELKILRPIVEQWLKINREYIEDYDYEDCLYAYNERSTISSFAGAVWRCGGYAQEEYIAVKGENEKNGRIDLYFNFANKDVIVEAKQKFIKLIPNSKKNFEKHITDSFNDSIKDIGETQKANNYGDLNLGISFIVPLWKDGSDQKENLSKIKGIVQNLKPSMYVILQSKKSIVFNEETKTVSNIVILLCKKV